MKNCLTQQQASFFNLADIFETFDKCSILPAQLNLLKFNRGSSSRKAKILTTPINYIGTSIHTLSILRIALKLHFVQNVEPVDKSRSSGTQKLGKRGRFAKVSHWRDGHEK